ncbi:IS91 family transposase [Desulfosediminicola flagellatus]|uniref:IS91 family transposase n=1 Tax=Desulfosediminicola flagellatus TaxID=2569541 RepID=UPI0010AD1AB4|nr:IS91 family transposase [Desulfosediminicola flagellatus]
MGRNGLELAGIIRNHGDSFSEGRSLSTKQKRVLSAIQYCRTERLGYHLDQCPECNHKEISYNSCRDRHCPKCQGIAQRQWVEKRTNQLLPVPYYHVVFTLPAGLFPFGIYNKKLIYNLLFDAAASTLKQFGADPKWLGGKIGFFGILHTWGQTLWHHPHVHFIVPGGAIGDKGQWIKPKHDGKFLFPVHAVSDVFRGKFMKNLEDEIKKDNFVLPDEMSVSKKTWNSEKFLRSLTKKDWIVYCKSPFKKADQVIKYIGRYTHRVAISNNRLLSMSGGKVTFAYRDYKENRCKKIMHLDAHHFLQRFLWHVLPEKFHRIRHYGFLANGIAEKSVAKIINQIGAKKSGKSAEKTQTGCICKNCGAGIMVVLKMITATGHLITLQNSPLFNSS